ncbi:MAG: FAD-dependent oxidoreductase [Ornithinimicrobium sp.]
MASQTSTSLLLVGAGHAHLYLLRRAEDLIAAGYTVSLLAPEQFRYSGMAAATATGVLPAHAGAIDVTALTADGPVRHHVGMLSELDLARHRARCDDGQWLDFDVISFNIGSVAGRRGIDVGDDVVTVKPLEELADLDRRVTAALEALEDSHRNARVTIVGGGPSSIELAGNLACRESVEVNVIEAGSMILPDLSDKARSRVARLLTSRGVRLHTGLGVTQVEADRVVLSDGRILAHDVVTLATGLVASPLVETFGLGQTSDGQTSDGIPVGPSLQHPEYDEVYAAGDCANFLPQPLARIGVYGVRQGPVLLASLVARASGHPVPQFRPQRHVLQVLDLGGGYGLAIRGRWWWLGRMSLRLKRWIDRRWMANYA